VEKYVTFLQEFLLWRAKCNGGSIKLYMAVRFMAIITNHLNFSKKKDYTHTYKLCLKCWLVSNYKYGDGAKLFDHIPQF